MRPTLPLLYSFRRCPYAIRARLALAQCEIEYTLCEVSLRNKPRELLLASAKATVPVLVLTDGTVIDQSLDIMHWALTQKSEPQAAGAGPRPSAHPWLRQDAAAMNALIVENDSTFKAHLDGYKYPHRFPEDSAETHRDAGIEFLRRLDAKMTHGALFGAELCFADFAIFPFVRQFAAHDSLCHRFQDVPIPRLKRWLETLLESPLFASVMATK
jgi:glutathione S-transferase